ncbi:hypothetical protein CONLIGDRAFT_685160 [Coniochaeta ligniaria NRRL 30616]|uniref:RRM domain-containing protein n=1 Tax=Coniochaeta ligniaria NRRL 30616 TaxID=1408157 RepID=A0A1J7IC72_9PEZI|nr:hypothetical protein CONLIGDRAFT_685160 [Coniochaeta ligniaria NRRL 30616]
MTEVSSTRLYLGNLPRNGLLPSSVFCLVQAVSRKLCARDLNADALLPPEVTKADIEAHFASHGTGEITEIKLMNGFGFIEYKDAMDARDVVPAFHGSDFMGERLTVQFARGSRHREGANFGNHGERTAPRPRRTAHRMQISGLPGDTSWQDLKDFARQSQLDVVYSETGRNANGEGFVEFESAADLRTAVEKLDGREFKGARVTCVANDVKAEHAPDHPAVLTDLLGTTTTVAVRPAEALVTALAVMVLTEMPTVRAALAGMTTTTVGEVTGRPLLRDARLWTTTLLPVVATMTATAVTTLRSLMSTAGPRTIALLQLISRRHHVMVAIRRGKVDTHEMDMSAGAATGN